MSAGVRSASSFRDRITFPEAHDADAFLRRGVRVQNAIRVDVARKLLPRVEDAVYLRLVRRVMDLEQYGWVHPSDLHQLDHDPRLPRTHRCGGNRDLSGSSTVLGSKSLVRLSQWSFALYLVHELVIMIRPFLTEMSAAETFGAAILAINAAIALSGLLHEFVEKPAEKWLRSRGALWLRERQRSLGYTTQRNG